MGGKATGTGPISESVLSDSKGLRLDFRADPLAGGGWPAEQANIMRALMAQYLKE
jgi:hypothetical protein